MPNICKNKVHVIGTYEAVAEVAMFLCQDNRIEVLDVHPTIPSSAGAVASIGSDRSFRLARFSNEPLQARPAPENQGDAWDVASFGIQPLSLPGIATGVVQLAFECSSAWGSPTDVVAKLSKEFPDTVVSVLANESGNAIWGLDAFVGGESILQVEADHVPVPESWSRRLESADEHEEQVLYEELDILRNAHALHQLKLKAARTLPAIWERRSQELPSTLRSHGWPRWSLLAHTAHTDGVTGLAEALSVHTTATEKQEALEAEFAAARELGIASWMDTALFGNGVKAPAAAGKAPVVGAEPFKLVDIGAFAAPQAQLLALLAKAGTAGAPEQPLAQALLASLSSPEARLECGLHPATFLTAAAAHLHRSSSLPRAASEGLEKLLAGLAARTPRLDAAKDLSLPLQQDIQLTAGEQLLRSVVAIAALPQVAPSQLKPALAAGVTHQFALGCLVARQTGGGAFQFDSLNPTGVLEALRDTYGSIGRLPQSMLDEVERMGPVLTAPMQALRTEEMMRERLAAPVAAAASQAPRRRAPGV